MKVVINKCFGGFGISPEGLLWLWGRGMKEIGTPVRKYYGGEGVFAKENPVHAKKWKERYRKDLLEWKEYLASKNGGRRSFFIKVFSPDERYCLSGGREVDRSSPLLIECVTTLRKRASDVFANLCIVEIPDGIEYEIDEYDGLEHIAEKHRVWR